MNKFFSACAELEDRVASRFQTALNTDADLKAFGMKVRNVTLAKSGGTPTTASQPSPLTARPATSPSA
jgi:hypothetical protein